MLLSGSAKFVEMSLQSSNVAKAVLAESEFKQTIIQGLESEGCHENDKDQAKLNPDHLEGDDKDDGIGAFSSGFSLNGIKVGDFKGSIEVVKMELRGVATEATRDFVVYYRKKGLGNLNALDPDKCKSADVTGCFVQGCTVKYSNTDDKKHCTEPECLLGGGGGGSGPPDCYDVVEGSENQQTIVGCSGTGGDETTKTFTTAIGFNAGKDGTGRHNTFVGHGAGGGGAVGISGNKNTFIGRDAGKATTTGSRNTFIGNKAGQAFLSGTKNIAIGDAVNLDDNSGDNQINIGNIIKAKPGLIKVCDPSDNSCMSIKKSGACEANHYLRGYDSDGNPICQQERCTPQTGIYFWIPENQCHHCPRASPLHRPHKLPPDNCLPCASNSMYILTGTNANTCQPCPTGQTLVDGVCKCPTDWDDNIERPYYCFEPLRNRFVCQPCKCGLTLSRHYASSHPGTLDSTLCCHRRFYNSNGKCCPLTKKNINGVCKCPPDKPYPDIQYYEGIGAVEHCKATRDCGHGFADSNGLCCRWGNYNKNGICCKYNEHNSNGRCCKEGVEAIPDDLGQVRCCGQGYTKDWHNSNGVCCPPNKHNDNGKCCPEGEHNSNGRCCPHGQHNYNGGCCPPGLYNSNRLCCPYGQQNYDGRCCTSRSEIIPLHYTSSGIRVCCQSRSGYHNSNGICCREGYHNSRGKCCPDDHHNSNGKCCIVGQQNYDGRCCTSRSEIIPGYSTSGSPICCISRWGRHIDNGVCCREGYHNSRGKCCPDDHHNSNGICCPDGSHYDTGIGACILEP